MLLDRYRQRFKKFVRLSFCTYLSAALSVVQVALFSSPTSLLGQSDMVTVASNPNKLLFMQALGLFYQGHYKSSERTFGAYAEGRPDALADWRLLYARYFDGFNLLPVQERKALLADISRAIGDYEAGSCSAEELRQITGGTIDCAYVGAALYSLRALVRVKFKMLGGADEDRKECLELSRQSSSVQADFLPGIAEYETSIRFFPERLALMAHGVPADKAEALHLIECSLEGNNSPFVDDVWFSVFEVEKRGGSDAATKELFDKYHLKDVVGYLHSRYPDNSEVRKFMLAHP